MVPARRFFLTARGIASARPFRYGESVDTEARAIISPQILQALVGIVGRENIISTEDELLVYECDAYTLEKNLPNVVTLPRTTEEVSKIAVLCSQHKIPVIPR